MACLSLLSRDLQDAAAHHPCPDRKRFPRKTALMLGASLAGLLAAAPALAQTATWTGAGGDDSYTTGGNWTGGAAPVGSASTAIFGAAVANRDIAIYTALDLGTLQVSGGAGYNFANRSNDLLTITGGFDISGTVVRLDNLLGTTQFLGGSASTATLFNDVGATLEFQNTATAGSAIISNSGTLSFYGGSRASSATITSNGGIVGFFDFSSGGFASISLTGAQLDIASHAGGGIGIASITGDAASTITLGSNGLTVGDATNTTFAGVISGAGGLSKTGTGTLTLSGANTYGGATRILGGTLLVDNASALPTATIVTVATAAELKIADGVAGEIAGLSGATGSGQVTLGAGSGLDIIGSGAALRFDGHIRDNGDGNLTVGGTGGSQTLTGTSIIGGNLLVAGSAGYMLEVAGPAASMEAAAVLVSDSTLRISGGATLNLPDLAGLLRVLDGSMIVTGAGTTATVAATMDVLGSTSLSSSLTVADGASMRVGGLFIEDGMVTVTGSGSRLRSDSDILVGCVCSGELIVANGATLEVAAGSGIIIASTGTLRIGNGGAAGTVLAERIENAGAIVANFSGSSTFDGVISDIGTLTKTGPGTLILNGTNTYTGATTVSGGTLVVNGSIEHSALTVDAGGAIGGAGRIGALTVNGTLSPGNSPGTLTVLGNLTLGAGATYLAEVQGPVADRVNVTGTASLAGTLQLVPLGGSYSFNSPYTLLSAAGGRSGTFGAVDSAFGAGIATEVSYTGNEVLLTLSPRQLTAMGATAPANAYAVASAIDGAVANGGNASPLFNLYNQPASSIGAAVNQLSGEAHAGVTALGFQAAGQFLGAMLDPNGRGRLAGASGGPNGAAGFTADLPSKRSATGPASFDPARFSLWGATFGARGRTEGERSVGSANRTLDDAHLAVGADVLLAPGTVAGVALGLGQVRASLSGGAGKVESGVFQAGLYGLTRIGPVDLAAAGGYARLDNDVHRAVPALGNALTSSYASTVWSGRLQASAQLASWGGLTFSPLAALQASHVSSPAVVERAGPGGNAAALSLAGRDDMTSRSELGVQLDGRARFGAVPVTGFVRVAWAHYFQRDAGLTASLIVLPGASFSASGARPDQDSALIAAGLDARLSERVSLGIRMDSELSAGTRSLGGTARLAVNF